MLGGMRRLFSFIAALALLAGGAWLLLIHVANADVIRGRILTLCGLMIAVGGYWLWEDFIAPMMRRKPGT
jgi:hypothetical protein